MERDTWVDYAKGIGIILVVYGHVAGGVYNSGIPMDESLFRLVVSIIYSFHMPLFFFLSGIFFYDSLVKRGASGLIRSKVDTVLYPYAVWSLLQGILEVVLSNYTNGNASIGDVLSFAWHPRAQFWFLYTLFLVFIISSIIYSQAGKKITLPLLVLFGALYTSKQFIIPTNQIVGWICGNIVFFTLGVGFNEVKQTFKDNRYIFAIILGALFLVGQYVFHITYGLNYTDGGIATLTLATISILFFISLSLALERFNLSWLTYIGASSMTIYLMHTIAGSSVRIALSKFFNISSPAIHIIAGTLIGVFAPLLAQLIIKKYRLGFLLSPPNILSAANNHSKKDIKQTST